MEDGETTTRKATKIDFLNQEVEEMRSYIEDLESNLGLNKNLLASLLQSDKNLEDSSKSMITQLQTENSNLQATIKRLIKQRDEAETKALLQQQITNELKRKEVEIYEEYQSDLDDLHDLLERKDKLLQECRSKLEALGNSSIAKSVLQPTHQNMVLHNELQNATMGIHKLGKELTKSQQLNETLIDKCKGLYNELIGIHGNNGKSTSSTAINSDSGRDIQIEKFEQEKIQFESEFYNMIPQVNAANYLLGIEKVLEENNASSVDTEEANEIFPVKVNFQSSGNAKKAVPSLDLAKVKKKRNAQMNANLEKKQKELSDEQKIVNLEEKFKTVNDQAQYLQIAVKLKDEEIVRLSRLNNHVGAVNEALRSAVEKNQAKIEKLKTRLKETQDKLREEESYRETRMNTSFGGVLNTSFDTHENNLVQRAIKLSRKRMFEETEGKNLIRRPKRSKGRRSLSLPGSISSDEDGDAETFDQKIDEDLDPDEETEDICNISGLENLQTLMEGDSKEVTKKDVDNHEESKERNEKGKLNINMDFKVEFEKQS
eukprot:CAMPEP_0115000832 /NCGR_PEP_ID=MMETSP0216-20121206/17000_1 /TAXON_ID=223996 /ORGANISM="Protocruzia adherens, Strain Boccale" /LENGTH=543 /DNA_ID=CAMNT_0002366021 /DNA_START=15 /DNA_END=1646 /DNA_ORIENTATION=-